MTHSDAGISESTNNQLHYIIPSPGTQKLYNKLLSDRVAKTSIGTIVADSTMALRTQLHQIEGGTIKINDGYHDLNLRDKINYLRSNFKMDNNTVVMANYIGEQQLLKKLFPQCTIASSTSQAEGVDYSHAHEFIIYSANFSGSKFVQRLDRIKNLSGSNTDTVHHLLIRGAISDQVYETVMDKKTFNDSVFKPIKL